MWFVFLFLISFEFGVTAFNSAFETIAMLSSCHCLAKFIWVWNGSSITYVWNRPKTIVWLKVLHITCNLVTLLPVWLLHNYLKLTPLPVHCSIMARYATPSTISEAVTSFIAFCRQSIGEICCNAMCIIHLGNKLMSTVLLSVITHHLCSFCVPFIDWKWVFLNSSHSLNNFWQL